MKAPESAQKVVELDALAREREGLRTEGLTVALANGLFDILHVGHLSYLEEAAEEADRLYVAVNSDESARALKGPSRPVTPDSERARLLAGFHCVDRVVVFPDLTVETVLRALRPDVHCKGTDYTAETIPEARLAGELGIRIAIVGDKKSHSTREIIQKVRKTLRT